ncbi:UNVERIFIED_CONTAM: hypothetical protein GTU68_047786 [Idotea baltica]|nr:hypothetical protein [Idotea baltica]
MLKLGNSNSTANVLHVTSWPMPMATFWPAAARELAPTFSVSRDVRSAPLKGFATALPS